MSYATISGDCRWVIGWQLQALLLNMLSNSLSHLYNNTIQYKNKHNNNTKKSKVNNSDLLSGLNVECGIGNA